MNFSKVLSEIPSGTSSGIIPKTPPGVSFWSPLRISKDFFSGFLTRTPPGMYRALLEKKKSFLNESLEFF